MPATVDLTGDDAIYRDDDYTIVIPFVDASNTPFPVDGYTFRAEIRKHRNRGATVADPVAVFTIDTTDAATGTITLSLDKTVTRTLPAEAVWDLQATIDGDDDTWLDGTVEVLGDVTREATP